MSIWKSSLFTAIDALQNYSSIGFFNVHFSIHESSSPSYNKFLSKNYTSSQNNLPSFSEDIAHLIKDSYVAGSRSIGLTFNIARDLPGGDNDLAFLFHQIAESLNFTDIHSGLKLYSPKSDHLSFSDKTAVIINYFPVTETASEYDRVQLPLIHLHPYPYELSPPPKKKRRSGRSRSPLQNDLFRLGVNLIPEKEHEEFALETKILFHYNSLAAKSFSSQETSVMAGPYALAALDFDSERVPDHLLKDFASVMKSYVTAQHDIMKHYLKTR
ncbi:MAG: hypothetical protein ACQESE_00995 [Nanobdellota archaeon]